MLIMSDLQLLTGLAIMISGFAQLPCGISTYHWQRIVNTAWFACVTHLSCLTFLRDHLLNNRITQLWRVPGMIVLTSMIIYALTTTSRYDQGGNGPTSFDQAICFLGPFFDSSSTDGIRGLISIVFLGFGMINRIRRLYHAPNVIMTKLRIWISHKARGFLMQVYGQGSADSFVACLAAVLVYRQLLTIFLMVRLLTDGLTSMAFEVTLSSLYKVKQSR
jgi:hypothetical protein